MVRKEKELQLALSEKERAETLLSNLEKLKEEGTIDETQYESMKSEYTQMLNSANTEIEQIKSEINREIGSEQRDLGVYKQELSNLEVRFKVGELGAEEYRKSEQRTRSKLDKIETKLSELNKLSEAKSSADLGGPIAVGKGVGVGTGREGGGVRRGTRGVSLDFGEAFRYPFQKVASILIGGVLYLLSFLIIPVFFVEGYFVRVMADTIEGKDDMPEWSDWGYLFGKGVGAFVISIVYLLIPMIIIGIVLGATLLVAIPTIMTGGFGAVIMEVLGGILVSIIIAFFFGFVLLVGLLRYADKGNIGAAFAFSEIIDELKEKFTQYLIAYLVLFGAAIVLGLVTAFIPIIGAIVAVFAGFYIIVVGARMFGEIYSG